MLVQQDCGWNESRAANTQPILGHPLLAVLSAVQWHDQQRMHARSIHSTTTTQRNELVRVMMGCQGPTPRYFLHVP